MSTSSTSWTWFIAAIVGGVVLTDIVNRHLKKHASPRVPLPPGPPLLPILGNVRGINVDAPWLSYADWANTYGDLLYSRFFNQDIIIINSETIAKELLEDRSANYSDRPDIATTKAFGVDFTTAFMPYGSKWRLQRSFIHQAFRADAVPRFKPSVQRQAYQLLRDLLESPDHCWDHLSLYTSSVIIKAVYDYDMVPRDDEMFAIIEKMAELTVEVVRPEVAAVLNAFPILLRLPSWLPGMSINKSAALARELAKDMLDVPFQHALQRLVGPLQQWYTTHYKRAEGRDTPPEWMQELRDASATVLAAASESSKSALMTFFLAMVLFPEAQAKAQTHIDSVCGRNRLPTLDDRPSLTFMDAVLRETLRWNPVAPLSVPHSTVNGDIYNGYYIPKGAVLLTNLWSIAHNEEKYPKPFEFIPERFLDAHGNLTDDNVLNIAFGHGRRICVGRHFADSSLWSAMANILAVFKLSLPKDKDGRDIPFKPKWASGATTHPVPFPICIVPRVEGLDVRQLEHLFGT
ncbi:cytochrome P450 [Phlebopus sp. FC_14]|nr:cytochrome P450 [Phlebopus sp. FC_14]